MKINDILNNKKPCEDFFCKHSDNNDSQIQFLSVRIRDIETGKIYLDISRPELKIEDITINESDYNEDELKELDKQRIIHYQFSKEMLYSKSLGFQMEFKVGNNPIKNFKILDRLFFKEKLLKEYSFDFPYCIPNTLNTWEIIYNIPELNDELINEILENPWKVNSDSFYFVQDKLIIQNKAYYNYTDDNKN